MRHLVVDSGCTADVIALCYLRAEDQNIFVEGHTANVLHGAPVVFSNCNLVILTEWVCKTEGFFEVGKALLGYFKDILGINIFKNDLRA